MSLETELAKANANIIEEGPGDDFLEPPVPGSREAQAAPDGYDQSRRSEPAAELKAEAKAEPTAEGTPKPDGAVPEVKAEAEPKAETPASPAEPAKPLILGRFKDEAEAQRYFDTLEGNQRQMGRLLEGIANRLSGLPGETAAPKAEPAKPEAPKAPTKDLVALLARAALGDEEVTDQTVLEAMLPLLKGQGKALGVDAESLRNEVQSVIQEVISRGNEQRLIVDRQEAFFSAHPDFKALGDGAKPHLALLARQTVADLKPEVDAGKFTSDDAYWTRFFTEVATRGRKLFNLPAPGSPTPKPAATAAPARASGQFAEGGGSPRSGAPAALTDQEREIAEVFS